MLNIKHFEHTITGCNIPIGNNRKYEVNFANYDDDIEIKLAFHDLESLKISLQNAIKQIEDITS